MKRLGKIARRVAEWWDGVDPTGHSLPARSSATSEWYSARHYSVCCDCPCCARASHGSDANARRNAILVLLARGT